MLRKSILNVAFGLCFVIFNCTTKPMQDDLFESSENLKTSSSITWDGNKWHLEYQTTTSPQEDESASEQATESSDEIEIILKSSTKTPSSYELIEPSEEPTTTEDPETDESTQATDNCPEGFQSIGDKCYHIETKEKIDWLEAIMRCEEMNGNLIRLESESELSEILKYLLHTQVQKLKFWVGNFPSLNMLRVMNSKWCPGGHFPNNVLNTLSIKPEEGDFCVDITILFDKQNYICEAKVDENDQESVSTTTTATTTTSTTTTPQPILTESGCPKEFKKLGNKCYFFEHSEELNWYETDRKCKKMKANMLTIENANEMELIESELLQIDLGVFPRKGWRGFWTAGTDLGSEGSFHWQTTGKTMSYTNWFAGEPNNFNSDEHCIELTNKYGSTRMNDMSCWHNRFYACETELQTSKVQIADLPKPTGLKGNSCYDLKLFRLNFEAQQLIINKLYDDQQCSKNDHL